MAVIYVDFNMAVIYVDFEHVNVEIPLPPT